MRAVPCPIEPERLQALYHDQKLTDDEIVDLLNSEEAGVEATVKRVRSWRKRFGIRTLERWERHEVPPIEGRLRSLLVGSMLGDGRLTPNRKAPSFRETHCEAQRAYLEWKAERWGPKWVTGGIRPVDWEGGRLKGVYFRTVNHNSLLPWRELFYGNRNGKGWKRLVPEVVDLVDEEALAIWYLDDGGVEWWPTIAFGSEASVPVALAIFDKFGLTPRWALKTATTGYFHMEREDTAHRFLEIIRPHVPACMSRKLTGFGFQGAHYLVRQTLTEETLRPLAEAGVPIKRIARDLGVGATTVGRYLKKFGIEHPRTRGNPNHRG